MNESAAVVALRFNDRINSRDLEGLVELITGDHVFFDTAGNTTRGREGITKAWASFFNSYAGYRNAFSGVESRGSGVTMIGRSECAEKALDGPAIWRAIIRGSQVAEWRVYEDTPEVRQHLGIQ